jgi:hypothetical protein
VVDREDVALHCGLAGYAPPYEGNEDIDAARNAVNRVFPEGLQAAIEEVMARPTPPKP